MISVIITTYREKTTLPKAIQAILDNIRNSEEFIVGKETWSEGQMFEILVIGPDQDTERIVREFSQKYPEVRYLKDSGVGKPAALNLAFQKAEGEILVLTDGDVWTEKDALRNLLKHFEIKEIGAVSGRPVSINPRNNIFGYWSHFLTEAAHHMRLSDKHWPCSGYLYAIRNLYIRNKFVFRSQNILPEDVLSEDAVITEMIRNQGYQIVYAPEAKVYVKYPDNFRDWIKQKVRATGGYLQNLRNYESVTNIRIKKMRALWQEIGGGLKLFFTYPQNLREFWWTILLYLARIYLWFLIFWQIKIRHLSFNQIWQRIESTKII